MLDAGARLETDKAALRDRLAASAPEDWPAELLARYKAGQFDGTPGGIRRFGSDFAIRDAGTTFENAEGIGIRASHAVGGLSNFWGSAVLPNRQADMADWPVSADDLAPHYSAVAGFMPIAAAPGPLDALLPAWVPDRDTALPPSPQGRALAERLERRTARLAAGGLIWGRARQAVSSACRMCGLCLHGCPWGHIFNAADQIPRLMESGRFTYLSPRRVRHVSEEGINARAHLDDGTTIEADAVFLAAGVLETARIVLASYPMAGPQLRLRDSQHFFTPLLHAWAPPADPETARAHALTELFLELDAPEIAPGLIHSQIYTWNEFYAREMVAKYGRVPGLAPIFRRLARRLVVAQSFLHSDVSGEIGLSLAADGRLLADAKPSPATGPAMTAARRRLAGLLRPLGLHALTFAGHAGAPGSSFHTGGTLPMRARPRRASTAPDGLLHGTSRTYVADASVLPAIPATTITFSVMANAHRIGSIVP